VSSAGPRITAYKAVIRLNAVIVRAVAGHVISRRFPQRNVGAGGAWHRTLRDNVGYKVRHRTGTEPLDSSA